MSASLKSSVSENQMLKKSLPIDIIVHLESIGDQFFHEG